MMQYHLIVLPIGTKKIPLKRRIIADAFAGFCPVTFVGRDYSPESAAGHFPTVEALLRHASQEAEEGVQKIVIRDEDYYVSPELIRALPEPAPEGILFFPSILGHFNINSHVTMAGQSVTWQKLLGTDVLFNEKLRIVDCEKAVFVRILRQRWKELLAFPASIKLELASACNLKCVMCLFHGDKYRHTSPPYVTASEAAVMDENLAERCLDECIAWETRIPQTMQMTLSVRGESLLFHGLEAFVARGRQHDIEMAFTTNGSLMSLDQSRRFLDAGINSIAFSLDRLNANALSSIRVNAQYYQIERNVRRFVAMRNKGKYATRVSVCRTVLHNEDLQDQRRFIDYWLQRVDSVWLQAEFVFSPESRAKEYNTSDVIRKQFTLQAEHGRDVCPMAFGITILADGRVVLCPCAFLDDSIVAGDVNRTPIHDIFHGPVLRRARELQVEGAYDQIATCGPCDVWKNYYTTREIQYDDQTVQVTPGSMFVTPRHRMTHAQLFQQWLRCVFHK